MIAYHWNQEAVASLTVWIGKESTDTNLADVFTKIMSAAQRDYILDRFMY